MTIPGVGAVVALSFVAAIETPETFTRSRDVGAWIGLTPRRYQSGEVDYEGHISRRGDARLRSLLFEAAMAMLTRVRGESDLRSWGSGVEETARLQARGGRPGPEAGGDHACDAEDRHRLQPQAARRHAPESRCRKVVSLKQHPELT